MALDCEGFLARATAAMVAAGAQPLLAPVAEARPSWAAGWDQILILQGAARVTLYALTCSRGEAPEQLRTRVDRLAEGVAGSNLLSGPPLSVVSIVAFPDGLTRRLSRSVTGITPSTFYQGIRPSTWAVDLQTGQVHARGALRRPPGLEILRPVMAGAEEAPSADLIASQGRERQQRLRDFYRLMRQRQPVVTYALAVINVAVFLVLAAKGGLPNGNLSESTLQSAGAASAHLVESGQWWRLFSLMFLHAGVAHILFNMVSLLVVGTLAERLYGSAKFLAIYLGAGFIASLTSFAHVVLTNQPDVLTVGASGAIFGVAGALLTVRFQSSDVIPEDVRRDISSWMIVLVVLNLVLGWQTVFVDNWAHLGGLVGGMGLSFVLPLTKRLREGGDAAVTAVRGSRWP